MLLTCDANNEIVIGDIIDEINKSDTIDLVLDIPSVDYTKTQRILVRGYSTIDDGGGGIFIYDSTKALENDGGMVIYGWVRQYTGDIHTEWFNAFGNENDTSKIQAAINFLNSIGGGRLSFGVGIYNVGELIIYTGIVLVGIKGKTTLRLDNNENSTLLSSYNFDTFYASEIYDIEQDPDFTQNYGVMNMIFEGNRVNNSLKTPLIKFYGRNLVLDYLVISDSAGIGLHTALKGGRNGTFESYHTQSPNQIDQINFIDTGEESWVFEGPADMHVGTIVTNGSGDSTLTGTSPQTSTMFPGEEVHGIRIEGGSFSVDTMNLNDAYSGRALFVKGRIGAGHLITSSSWGCVLFDYLAYGEITQLLVQANNKIWDGVVHPAIENYSSKIQIIATECARFTTNQQPNAYQIEDNAGAQWGLIKSRNVNVVTAGPFMKINTPYIEVPNLTLDGESIGIHTTALCGEANIVSKFKNCDLFWKNERENLIGSFDMGGSLESGQVFTEGVDITEHNGSYVHKFSLAASKTYFYQDGHWYTNGFFGGLDFDPAITSTQTIVFTHGMWRPPVAEELSVSAFIRFPNVEPAGMQLWIEGFDATTVTVNIKFDTAIVSASSHTVLLKIGT